MIAIIVICSIALFSTLLFPLAAQPFTAQEETMCRGYGTMAFTTAESRDAGVTLNFLAKDWSDIYPVELRTYTSTLTQKIYADRTITPEQWQHDTVASCFNDLLVRRETAPNVQAPPQPYKQQLAGAHAPPTGASTPTLAYREAQSSNFVVLPGKSVGNFYLGMTKEDMLKIAPRPQKNSSDRLVYQSGKTGNTLIAHLQNNTIMQIAFTSKDFKTEEGIHTGNFREEKYHALFDVSTEVIDIGNSRDEKYAALFDVSALPSTFPSLKFAFKTGGLTFYHVNVVTSALGTKPSRAVGVVHAGKNFSFSPGQRAATNQTEDQSTSASQRSGAPPSSKSDGLSTSAYVMGTVLLAVLLLAGILSHKAAIESKKRQTLHKAAIDERQTLQKAIQQRFLVQSCSTCHESQMQLIELSPNARSVHYQCASCGKKMRAAAGTPDAPEVSAILRHFTDLVKQYNQRSESSPISACVKFETSPAPLPYEQTRRSPIPEDVKSEVWRRDTGHCVHCGSKENLQFDHIIPVILGGATSVKNLQLLCQTCNLVKGKKI